MGTRLHVMALSRCEEAGAFHAQQVDWPDIDAMSASLLAAAIADEGAVAHDQRAAPHAAMQDAVFVAQEAHALDSEVATVPTDSGAVAVGAAGAGESHTADGDVVAGNDENALPV